MSRNTRLAWANGVIVAGALAGGLVLTNHFAPGSTTQAAPAPSTSTAGGNSAGKTGSATGAAVQYQFGQVQVTVTKTNGKITAIDYGSSTASAGRDQAFPILVQEAITAQGSNISNLSGATYTTDAFKQALSSAITKLG
jgi:uncharacterized protein with FMN-binding domain